MRSRPSPPRRPTRSPRLAAAALAAFALLPSAARGEAEPLELVAEALFLADPLPPGGRDLNLSLAVERSEDPETGEATVLQVPRAQLALALGERLGLTADVGLGMDGESDPGGSLKVLLRSADEGRTGVSASLDLFGSSAAFEESEAGIGVGAIRGMGRLALRASAAVASAVNAWSPHLHAGASAALALGSRWRALAEVVSEVGAGEVTVAAGPTLKVALGQRTSLMAGALFQVAPTASAPAFLVQLTQSM